MLNKWQGIGNLGQDPELREYKTKQGEQGYAASFSIAANRGWGDNKKTYWARCTAFGNNAKNVAEYCSKGSKVYVEGSLELNEWTDKEGVERQTTQVICDRVLFLDSRSDSAGGAGSASAKDLGF